MHSHPIALLLTLIMASFVFGERATADQSTFCVVIKTYDGDGDAATAEHRIVFDNGLVYDLPQISPATVTMYDPAQLRVTLLNRPSQTQSTLSTEDLVKVTAMARAAADTPSKRDQLGLGAFVQRGEAAGNYSIKFSGATYETTTQRPASQQMAKDFGQFSDLASRLNLVRRHWLPPFARMTLSDRLTADGVIPLAMTLTIERREKIETYRTTMSIEEPTRADQSAIEEVRGMMTLYREVPLTEIPGA